MGFFDSLMNFFKSDDSTVTGTYEIVKPEIIGEQVSLNGYTFEKSKYLYNTGSALELDINYTVADSQDDAEDKLDEQVVATGICIGQHQEHKSNNVSNYKVLNVTNHSLVKSRIEYDMNSYTVQGITVPAKHVIVYVVNIGGTQKDIMLTIYYDEYADVKQKAMDSLELMVSTFKLSI